MSEGRRSPVGGATTAAPASASSASSSEYSHQTEHEHENTGRNEGPQTPQHRRGRSEPHNAFSPMPSESPKLPSPMALNFFRLGIGTTSPLSPFRRQFSSNFSTPSVSPAVTRDGAAAEADDELSEQDYKNHGPHSDDGDDDDDDDSEEDEDDLTQDSKDVLVDRLNDLLKRLSSGSLAGANISTLHAKVDEMERVLASDHHKPARPDRLRQRPSILQLASPLPIVRSDTTGPQTPEQRQSQPDYWGFTRTPPRLEQPGPPLSDDVFTDSPHHIPNEVSATDSQPDHVQGPHDPPLSSEDADRLVAEAEKLCTELNTVVKNLQDRREESDARPLAPFLSTSTFHTLVPTRLTFSLALHIHEMLVDRAEAAAKRILELNDYVSVLEDEISTNKSDLEHLRLQLRALEVLCYEYVPADADRDLLQSIENWKSDYTRIKLKMASRRRERNPHVYSAAGSPSVLSPSTSVLMERAGLY